MVCVGGFIALFLTPLPHQFKYSLLAWLKQFLSYHIPGFHGCCPEQAFFFVYGCHLRSCDLLVDICDRYQLFDEMEATGSAQTTSLMVSEPDLRVKLCVYGKPFSVEREAFACFEDHLYFQLWLKEICNQAWTMKLETSSAEHVASCEATVYKNQKNLQVLRFTACDNFPRCFTRGQMVQLSRTDPSVDAWKAFLTSSVSGRSLDVLQPKQLPYDIDSGVWRLDVVSDENQRDRLLHSLKWFCTATTRESDLRPLIVGHSAVSSRSSMQLANSRSISQAEESALLTVVNSQRFNDSQCSALRGSLSHSIVLIQGPPGTGKTTTSLAIVGLQKRLLDRVVFAAASNNGCDELAERLLRERHRLVRYGEWKRMSSHYNNTVRRHNARYKAFMKLSESYAHENTAGYKAARRKIFDKEFGDLEALHCGTLDSFGGDAVQCQIHYAFAHVEEAAQCTETSLLPLLCRCDRVCLAGDPQQLPPHAHSELLSISMMERLAQVDGMDVYHLDEQYRMPESLIRWPNKQFYGGMLKTATQCSSKLPQGFPWPQVATTSVILWMRKQSTIPTCRLGN